MLISVKHLFFISLFPHSHFFFGYDSGEYRLSFCVFLKVLDSVFCTIFEHLTS